MPRTIRFAHPDPDQLGHSLTTTARGAGVASRRQAGSPSALLSESDPQ